MVVATAAALYFASSRFNILELLVFVGAVWGALVFPVIASFYWKKVTNKAFTVSVLVALAVFLPIRFSWLPLDGGLSYVVDVLAVVGVGVVAGLMAFGFFGVKVGRTVGGLAAVAALPFGIGFLHEYAVLSSSLLAYGVSMLLCTAMSWRSSEEFDFTLIAKRTGRFDTDSGEEPAPATSTGVA